MTHGGTVWITGLSGAGKTTVARALCERLREKTSRLVFLDGDTMRAIFGADKGYGTEDRRSLAASYGRLCRELAGQGLFVVCATISMFDSVREWNRKNIKGYTEIYLKAPLDLLAARHPKGLYDGEVKDVMGVDIAFEEPKAPDMVFENDGRMSPDAIADMIVEKLNSAKGE